MTDNQTSAKQDVVVQQEGMFVQSCYHCKHYKDGSPNLPYSECDIGDKKVSVSTICRSYERKW
jgi:hypothetical protein